MSLVKEKVSLKAKCRCYQQASALLKVFSILKVRVNISLIYRRMTSNMDTA